ncbi:ABC transporter ATP-binding protein [Candidatus Methylopumilus planktonicus]|uniref:ABC transporter ATP-binding protein n=1 Tax=Candidatus Methylopumilus planktonicus TaxID=1581557 RepID=UPI003BEEB5D8
MAHIKLDQASVEIPIYSNHNRSIKNSFLKKLTNDKSQVQSVTALHNINLELKDGDRLGVMGPNGAGKSTLLRTLAGVYLPTSGTIKVKGSIASLIDISLGMDAEATGYENIRMRAIMMGMKLKQIKLIEDEIADFTELGKFLELPIRTYSTGMHMRLGFAVSTTVPADIILMDEWLSVGDSDFLIKAEKRLHDYIQKSSILVLASHSEDLISKLTNQTLRLEHQT